MEALSYLAPTSGAAGQRIYLFFAAAACFIGCVIPFEGALAICDACNGIMAVPNILALLRLYPVIFEENSAKVGINFTKFSQIAKKL